MTSPVVSNPLDSFDTPRIERSTWRRIIWISIAAGCCLHALLVLGSYCLTLRLMQRAPAGFAAEWLEQDGTLPAQWTLQNFGIKAEEGLKNDLAIAWKSQAAAAQPVRYTPVLKLATAMLVKGSCAQCADLCGDTLRSALTRQLLGWPGDTSDEFNKLRDAVRPAKQPLENTPGDKEPAGDATQACDHLEQASTPRISPLRLIAFRSEPKSPRALAEALVSEDQCYGNDKGQARCELITQLFQTVIDAGSVRASRSLLLNFFYGPERLLVWILFFIVLLALRELKRQGKALVGQQRWVAVELAKADSILDKRKSQPPRLDETPQSIARQMHENFTEEMRKPGYKHWAQGPQVIRELVSAMDECAGSQDRHHLEDFVDLHLNAIERQRDFLNALITVFPAIGLLATLNGLIRALSGASSIVAGVGHARVDAVTSVTSILSSSFSTTFLALACMTLFAVLNIHDLNREKALLKGVHKMMLAVFWPNR